MATHLRLGFVVLFFCSIGLSQGKIDSQVLEAFKTNGKQDVLVDFEGSNSRTISAIQSKSFRSRISKVKALTDGLKANTKSSQNGVQEYLRSQNVQHNSYWSSNQMVVKGVNLNTVKSVAAFSEVSNIQMLPKTNVGPIPSSVTPQQATVQWGIKKIMADKVWSELSTQGEGVVVANIDTGVRGTHKDLVGNWRADHGWFDPYPTKSATPDDENGHGTHTMGTIAGADGIGVAPGSTWIACRGCNTDSCGGDQLLACGQWMLAPTNPNGTDADPTKIPDVVSNSWGSSLGNSGWYNPTIAAWKEAGILSAFAIGNSGPFCRTGGSPGDQTPAFSVGSIDNATKLSLFSSKGPAGSLLSSYFKPEIVAPGSDIYSAWCDKDDGYKIISGTSMATPHVSGVMALMLSAYRNKQGNPSAKLNFDKVTSIIEQTAVTENLRLSTLNFPCDLKFGRFPNSQFGYGLINALSAVNATLSG